MGAPDRHLWDGLNVIAQARSGTPARTASRPGSQHCDLGRRVEAVLDQPAHGQQALHRPPGADHVEVDVGAVPGDDVVKTLLVSERAYGRTGFDELLLQYHGQSIRAPLRDDYLPADGFLAWHEKQVFKRPARELKLAG